MILALIINYTLIVLHNAQLNKYLAIHLKAANQKMFVDFSCHQKTTINHRHNLSYAKKQKMPRHVT